MRNTVSTAYAAVPVAVTEVIGHLRRNQRSRCRNAPGHVRRYSGHDPGITGHVEPEYTHGTDSWLQINPYGSGNSWRTALVLSNYDSVLLPPKFLNAAGREIQPVHAQVASVGDLYLITPAEQTASAAMPNLTFAEHVTNPSPLFSGGRLQIWINTGAETADQLSLPGTSSSGFWRDGMVLKLGSTAVGMVNTAATSQSNPLIFTFTTDVTLAQLQDLVRTVQYTHAGDAPNAQKKSILLTLTDASGVQTYATAGYVSVTAVNDAPVVGQTSFTLGTQSEDSAGMTWATSTLAGSSAAQAHDPDLPSTGWGIALTGFTGLGKWYAILGANTTEIPVGTVTSTNAFYLPPTYSLRYVPDGVNGETATATYRVHNHSSLLSDGSSSRGNPNSLPSSVNTSGTATASVEVTEVDDPPTAPVFTASGASLLHSASGAISLGTLTASDPEGGALTYAVASVDGNAGDSRVMMDGATLKAPQLSLFSHGNHSAVVRVTDITGLSAATTFNFTVTDDVAPSAPTGLALATVDDTGRSNSDGITHQTTALTLTGAAEVGATVTVYEDDGGGTFTPLGTTTASAAGLFQVDVDLGNGSTHQLVAKATDSANLTSTASAALSITVDADAPTGPVLALQTDSVNNSPPDNLAMSGVVEVTGLDSGALWDYSTDAGSTWTTGSGNTFTIAAGTHAADGIQVRQTDAAGNASGVVGNGAPWVVDVQRPGPVSATVSVDGMGVAAVVLSFDELLNGFSPNPSDFTLRVNNSSYTPTSATSDGASGSTAVMLLFMSNSFSLSGATVSLSYTGSTISDMAGNTTPTFTHMVVSNLDANAPPPAPKVQSIALSHDEPTFGVLNAGDTVSVALSFNETVTVDEGTGTPPQLALRVGDNYRFAQWNASSQTFDYTIQAGDDDADGISLPPSALDLSSGNGGITSAVNMGVAADLSYAAIGANANFKVDNQAPSLNSVSLSSNNSNPGMAITGDTVTLRMVASEALNINGSIVTINGNSATMTWVSGTTYTATRVLNTSDSDGHVSFSIQAQDLAGNVQSAITSTSDASAVVADAHPPTLSVVSLNTSHSSGTHTKAGDTVTLNFTTSEAIDLKTSSASLGGIGAVLKAETGTNNYSATRTITSSDTQGTMAFSLTVQDLGRNATTITSTTNSSSITIDTQAPVISAVSLSTSNPNTNATGGWAKAGDTLTLNFSLDAAPASLPTVSLGGQTVSPSIMSGQNYQATWVVPNNQITGLTQYSISALDSVGNVAINNNSTAVTGITTDTTAPQAQLSVDSGGLMMGQTTVLRLQLSDVPKTGTLDASDVRLTVNGSAAGSLTNWQVDASDPTLYTATLQPPALSNGVLDISVPAAAFQDRAGNASLASNTISVGLNTQAPAATVNISPSTILTDRLGLVAVTFTQAVTGFDLNDLSAGGGSLSNLSTSDSGRTWTAQFTPTPNATTSGHTITLDGAGVTDVAGNPVAGSPSSGVYAVDTQTPAAPTLNAVAGDDVIIAGESSSGLLLSGTAEVGSQVDVDWITGAGVSHQSTTPDSGGTWQLTLPSTSIPESGVFLLQVSASDSAGNHSASIIRELQLFPEDNRSLIVGDLDQGTWDATANDYLPYNWLSNDAYGDTGSLQLVEVNGTPWANLADSTHAKYLASDGFKQIAGTHGTLWLSDDGWAVYQHTGGTASTDSFSYRANDGTTGYKAVAVTYVASALAPSPSPSPAPAPSPSPAPAPSPAPSPAPPQVVVDGASVTTTTTTSTTSTGQTVNQTTQTVAPVGTPPAGGDGLADIPLVTDSSGNPLLEVSLPTGVGLQVTSISGTGLSLDSQVNTAVLSMVSGGSSGGTPPTAEDQALASAVTEGLQDAFGSAPPADLVVRSMAVTVEGNTPPTQPIQISGSTNGNEALIIDVSNLPSGTVLDLSNVRFAVIVGNTTLSGGEGRNVVVADGGRQFMVLGADDDELHAGGGDDTVASKGGDDKLWGDEGNDKVVGGIGNDELYGGDGNDIIQGGPSDAGQWGVKLDAQGQLHITFTPGNTDLADSTGLNLVGTWTTPSKQGLITDARLSFVHEDYSLVQDVALLIHGLAGRLPTLSELGMFATAGFTSAQLAEAAYSFFLKTLGFQSTSIETQAKFVVNKVLGVPVGTTNEALLAQSIDTLTNGGTWADVWLNIVRSDAHKAKLPGASSGATGLIPLVQNDALSETGWSANAGDNKLYGDAGNDLLIGGSGSNLLDGGTGTDLAVFFGALGDFEIARAGNNASAGNTATSVDMLLRHKVTGAINTLHDVEYLKVGATVYAVPAVGSLPAGDTYAELSSYVHPVITGQLAGFAFHSEWVS